MKKNKRILKSILASACISATLFGITAAPASAISEGTDAEITAQTQEQKTRSIDNYIDTRAKHELSLKGISNTSLRSYSSLPIYKDGVSLGIRARLINGLYYIPVRSFISKTTAYNVSYYSKTRTLTVSGKGLYMTMSDGSYTVYANDRALFEGSPARIMSDGAIYIPAKTLAKALGLRLSVVGESLSLSGAVSPIKSGADFYDADSVYWLSRIISAESRGEPLLGQIAVGNVILNRVKSKSFPNTIWGVIFDRKYGIQFSPVANGTIYNTPSYNSVLAAKIVLEGYSVSDEVLYFIAPRHATSSWISNNRSYAFTIKNHEFYG